MGKRENNIVLFNEKNLLIFFFFFSVNLFHKINYVCFKILTFVKN